MELERVAFAAIALTVVVSACGGRGDEGGQATTGRASTFEVWFVANEGFLSALQRPAKPDRAVERDALESLLAGPSQDEAAAGVFTAVPAGTELLGLEIDDSIATVDLSSQYEEGSGSAAEFLRLGQVVYTFTQFETVDAVEFRIDGKAVELFGGHGIMLDRPQRRQDYQNLLPANPVEN